MAAAKKKVEKKYARFDMRVPASLRKKIEAVAKRQKRTITSVAIEALEAIN